MPIQKRWALFSWENVEEVPEDAGAYELGNSNGEVVYVGSSRNLHQRLIQHKNDPSKRRCKYFRYELTTIFEAPSDLERRHGERYEDRYGRLPPKQKRLPRSNWPF